MGPGAPERSGGLTPRAERPAVQGRGGPLRKSPGRGRFPTEPAPAGSPGWPRSSDLGLPRAPRHRERKERRGKGGSGERRRSESGLKWATPGASSLSARPTAGAAIWWRIWVFQSHVVLNVTTGLSTWQGHFEAAVFKNSKFAPALPLGGALIPLPHSRRTALLAPSTRGGDVFFRATAAATRVQRPEGSVTEPGARLKGRFTPRFPETGATAGVRSFPLSPGRRTPFPLRA